MSEVVTSPPSYKEEWVGEIQGIGKIEEKVGMIPVGEIDPAALYAQQQAMIHNMAKMTEGMAQSNIQSSIDKMEILKGTESQEMILKFFRRFENYTQGKDGKARLELLEQILSETALFQYKQARQKYCTDSNYEIVKEEIMKELGKHQPTEALARATIVEGIKQEEGESIDEYGRHLQKTFRDGYGNNVCEALIKEQFLANLLDQGLAQMIRAYPVPNDNDVLGKVSLETFS